MNRQGLTTMELAGVLLLVVVIGAVNAHRHFTRINASLDHEISEINVSLDRIDGHLDSIEANLDRMRANRKSKSAEREQQPIKSNSHEGTTP